MIRKFTLFVAVCASSTSVVALADSSDAARKPSSRRAELPPYLQCVPYARHRSGVNIFGDAHTWWKQAKGHYKRGKTPKIGAVMAFAPHRNMRLGHVAAVSKIIDKRTVLLDHANWSPINGRRGQIERNVKAIDVSPNNDWSSVRVWYDPIQDLGKTPWPVRGFIYPDKPGLKSGGQDLGAPASRRRKPSQIKMRKPINPNPSPAFAKAFDKLPDQPKGQKRASQPVKPSVSLQRTYRQAPPLQTQAKPAQQSSRAQPASPPQRAKPAPKVRKRNARKDIYSVLNIYE